MNRHKTSRTDRIVEAITYEKLILEKRSLGKCVVTYLGNWRKLHPNLFWCVSIYHNFHSWCTKYYLSFSNGILFQLAPAYFRCDPTSSESFFVLWYVKLVQIHLTYFLLPIWNCVFGFFQEVLVPMSWKELFRDRNLGTQCDHV